MTNLQSGSGHSTTYRKSMAVCIYTREVRVKEKVDFGAHFTKKSYNSLKTNVCSVLRLVIVAFN